MPFPRKQIDEFPNLGRKMATGGIYDANWWPLGRVSLKNRNEPPRAEIVTYKKRGQLADTVTRESRVAQRFGIARAEAPTHRHGALVRDRIV